VHPGADPEFCERRFKGLFAEGRSFQEIQGMLHTPFPTLLSLLVFGKLISSALKNDCWLLNVFEISVSLSLCFEPFKRGLGIYNYAYPPDDVPVSSVEKD